MTGVLAGSFIYFSGFRSIDISPEKPTPRNSFAVQVNMYGGCEMARSCSAYRLDENGDYTFLYDDLAEPLTDTLPKEWLSLLRAAFANFDYQTQSQVVNPTDCDSWTDGIDYRYQLTVGNAEYVLDTCGTNVDVDDKFIELLDELHEKLREKAAQK